MSKASDGCRGLSRLRRIHPRFTSVHGPTSLARAFLVLATLAWVAFPRPAVAQSGPVAAFGFEEGAGAVVTDASGNGNSGTIGGATWTAGRYGAALDFDGSAMVTIPDSPSLDLGSAMTLEAWVYPTAAGGALRDVIFKAVDLYYLRGVTGSSANLVPAVGGVFATNPLSSTHALPLNEWSHLAATYDRAVLRLYVDGVQVASRPQTGAIRPSDGDLTIGGDARGRPWAGRIDEVRIYDRALSAAAIQVDMETPVSGAPADASAPVRTNGLPSGTLPAGTTLVTLSLRTDEAATCRYATTAGVAYASMSGGFATTGGTSHSTALGGLVNGHSYAYYVRCQDAASNANTSDFGIAFSLALPQDTQAPSVVMTQPASGSTVSGTITLAAGASDDSGTVAGVRFLLAGNPLSPEDEAAPFTLAWDTRGVVDGTYLLTALAVDPSLNTATSTAIVVTVANATSTPPGPGGGGTSPPPGPVPVPTPSLPGLVAAYGFDEGSGSTVGDFSGHGNHGSVSGATWTNSGRHGQALVFDGSNDVVVVPDSSSLDLTLAMTLSAWVYPTRPLTHWTAILQKEVDAWFLNANTDGNRVGTGGTTSSGVCCTVLQGPSALAVNQWTHVAATYDGATLRLYLDATQVAAQPYNGAFQVNALPLRIGGNTYGGEFFPGRIDDVRIYDRALSASEIQSDASTPVSQLPPSPPARARVETILFVDGAPAASQPVGFRLHLGSSPGQYSSVVDIGMPPAGRTGVRAYTFEVDRQATPYIALTAYDAQGRTSNLSNEIERAPRPPAFDHDGRGTSDLLLVDPRGNSLGLVRSDGTTSVAAPGVAAPEHASIAAQGDYDGDAITDVLWLGRETGGLTLWLLKPGGAVQTVNLPTTAPGPLRGSGDLDGDANADLVFERPLLRALSLWFLEGAAVLDRVALAAPPRPWSLVGIGDVNADRRSDLVWRHGASGHIEVWLMNGAAVLEEVAFPVSREWETLGLGDYDGDGASELVLRNLGDGRLESVSLLSRAALGAPLAVTSPAGSALAVGRDFNGDGFADLVRVDPFRRAAELLLLDPTGPIGTLPLDLAQVALPGDFASEIGDDDNDWNPNYCDGDFDNDGVVGTLDLRRIQECFDGYAISGCSGLDLDRDGVVGTPELAIVQRGLGRPPCTDHPTP